MLSLFAFSVKSALHLQSNATNIHYNAKILHCIAVYLCNGKTTNTMNNEKVKEIKGVQAVTLLMFLEKMIDKAIEEIPEYDSGIKANLSTMKLLMNEINNAAK